MSRRVRRHRTASKRVAQGTAAAVTATLVMVPPAGATPFPGNSTSTLADNSLHTICRSELTEPVSAAVAWASTRIDATDMSSSILACTSDTDSVNYDQDYTTFAGHQWHGSGGQVIGLNLCVDQSKGICHQSEDRYDNSWTNGAIVNQRRSLALHEIGHSIGFGHEPNFTNTEVMSPSVNNMTDYSAHEKGHINGAW